MQDIRVDEQGEFRCWKCGSKNFNNKRTARAKALGVATGGIGLIGTAMTHKKLKCQACGEYNQTGNAQPFDPEKIGQLPTARESFDRSLHKTWASLEAVPSIKLYRRIKAKREAK